MKKKVLVFVFSVFCGFSFAQIGINTVLPLSTLDINGNLSVKVINLTGSVSPTPISDGVYISVTPTANDQQFRLPSPIAFPGRMYIIRNVANTNTAVLITPAGQFFYKNTTGQTNGTNDFVYMNESTTRSAILISDGANWTVFN